MYDLIIIGSGPAGLSAAIYGKRAGLDLLVMEMAPMSGGQVLNTYEVDNYLGMPGINGFDMGMQFREHADKLEAEFVDAEVLSVEAVSTGASDGEVRVPENCGDGGEMKAAEAEMSGAEISRVAAGAEISKAEICKAATEAEISKAEICKAAAEAEMCKTEICKAAAEAEMCKTEICSEAAMTKNHPENYPVYTLHTTEGDFETKTVLLATGAGHAHLGVPGEEEFSGRGVSYCATCDGAFFRGKAVAVVGGGDVALEDAIYLSRFCEKVYLIHRRDELRGARILQKELLAKENVEILYSHTVQEIQGTDQVTGVLLKDVKTGEEKELVLQGVFIAVGIIPHTELLKGIAACDQGGYVIAGEDCITDVPGIFVAGDARKKPLRQIITAVADGANAVTSISEYLTRANSF